MRIKYFAYPLSLALALSLLLACQKGSATPPTAFSVVYEANGATSGSVPVDSGMYKAGTSVSIYYATDLRRDGLGFDSWNTKQDGSGIMVLPGQTYTMGSSDLYLFAQWSDSGALRAQGETPSGEIGFYVSGGTSFEPMVETAPGAAVHWYFTGYGGGIVGGDAESASTAPSVAYTGTMLATLRVIPWSAIRTIDIGYDGGDQGMLPATYDRPQQNVAEVRGLSLAKASLRIWCSSHNVNLRSLNFSGFAALHTIESYYDYSSEGDDVGLTSIDLTGAIALERLCLENNDLAALDLSSCHALQDLRGAQNAYTTIVWPAGSLDHLWHVCVRDNPQLTTRVPVESMPALTQAWLWHSGQAGAFAPVSQLLSSVYIWENDYTSIDLRGAKFSSAPYELNAHYCTLTSVSVGSSGVRSVSLDNCGLDQAAVDALVHDLATSNGVSGGTLSIRNNAGNPTLSPDYEALTSMGWAVTYP